MDQKQPLRTTIDHFVDDAAVNDAPRPMPLTAKSPIEEDLWIESQLEEPERWDGMS
jgi:hypothetical protein